MSRQQEAAQRTENENIRRTTVCEDITEILMLKPEMSPQYIV